MLTSTAKLVRCVVIQVTDVSLDWFLSTVSPSVDQPPIWLLYVQILATIIQDGIININLLQVINSGQRIVVKVTRYIIDCKILYILSIILL